MRSRIQSNQYTHQFAPINQLRRKLPILLFVRGQLPVVSGPLSVVSCQLSVVRHGSGGGGARLRKHDLLESRLQPVRGPPQGGTPTPVAPCLALPVYCDRDGCPLSRPRYLRTQLVEPGQLSVVRCQLSVVRCPLSVVRCEWSIVRVRGWERGLCAWFAWLGWSWTRRPRSVVGF